jgi:serine/threonine protein phosphatase 1
VDENTKQLHINFLLSLEDYHLDRKVFYPCRFTNMNGVKYEFYQNYYWDRTLWEAALALDRNIKPNDLLY